MGAGSFGPGLWDLSLELNLLRLLHTTLDGRIAEQGMIKLGPGDDGGADQRSSC